VSHGKPPRRPDVGGVLVLDDDGLCKAAIDRVMYVRLELAQRRRAQVVTSAAVLAEVIRGHARDARIYRVLAGINVEAVTDHLGQCAGRLIGAAGLGTDQAVDAMVAATAIAHAERAELAGHVPSVLIVTSDVPHLSTLVAQRAGVQIAHVDKLGDSRRPAT
jgi:predicted nucleic acid-binding protein